MLFMIEYLCLHIRKKAFVRLSVKNKHAPLLSECVLLALI